MRGDAPKGQGGVYQYSDSPGALRHNIFGAIATGNRLLDSLRDAPPLINEGDELIYEKGENTL